MSGPPQYGAPVVFVGPRHARYAALILRARENTLDDRCDVLYVEAPGRAVTAWNVPHRTYDHSAGGWFWPDEVGFNT